MNPHTDSFCFTMFHEIGHIINGDFGISFDMEIGEQEDAIRRFADRINRDPGIVLGRLQNDEKVDYNDWTIKAQIYSQADNIMNENAP